MAAISVSEPPTQAIKRYQVQYVIIHQNREDFVAGRPFPLEYFAEQYDNIDEAYTRMVAIANEHNALVVDTLSFKKLYTAAPASCWEWASNPTKLLGTYYTKHPCVWDCSTEPPTMITPKEVWGEADHSRPLPKIFNAQFTIDAA